MKKIALITGGGSGIGRACGLCLALNDFHVILCGRKLSALEKTIELMDDPESGTAISCDVTEPDQVDELFQTIEQKFGRLDVLFNNAGNNVKAATIGDVPPDDFIHVMNVNILGAFLLARGAFNLMRRQKPQGGRIINNGSISAAVPRPGSAPYTTSKHAITGLTRSISLDGRPFNIACGQIDIGNAASDMTSQMETGVPQADLSIKVEPVMDVAHVASTVLHMAQLPLDANVQFVTVMASTMPFIGRG